MNAVCRKTKRMTKKRLIRRIMAYRYQRNEAEAYALIAWSSGLSYAEWFERHKPFFAIEAMTRIVSRSARHFSVQLGEAFASSLYGLTKAAEAMRQAFKEAKNDE